MPMTFIKGQKFTELHRKRIKEAQNKKWDNPLYRKMMSDSHKGKSPANIDLLISLNKTPKRREQLSNRMKGKPAWNKGIKCPQWAGKNSSSWKGGLTSLDRLERVRFGRTVQKEVFIRDNYTCQLCGIRGQDMQVDHIQTWKDCVELRFSMDNCRTLCAKCHYKITFGHPMPEHIKAWGHNLLKGVDLP